MTCLVVVRAPRSADPSDWQRGEVVHVCADEDKLNVGVGIRNDSRFALLTITDNNDVARQRFYLESWNGPQTLVPDPNNPGEMIPVTPVINRRQFFIDPDDPQLPAQVQNRVFAIAIDTNAPAEEGEATEEEVENATINRDTGTNVIRASINRSL